MFITYIYYKIFQDSIYILLSYCLKIMIRSVTLNYIGHAQEVELDFECMLGIYLSIQSYISLNFNSF